MKRMPYTRLISTTLAALVMISLLPFASCGTKATQTEKSAPADNVSQAATTPEDIQNQLVQAKEPAPPSASEQAISSLADTGAKAAELAADPLKAASDTEALKASVEDGVSQVEGTLSSTRDKLAELGLSSKQDQFEAASAQISAELYSVRQASANLKEDDPASYSALSEKIDSLLASPEPTVLSSNLSHLTDSNQPTPPTYGTSIAPAYLSGTPGLTPSSLPPEPGDGDLAETPDAPQTEEIIALATQLNHNPVAIYEWVRNNIDFESYYGSRKGAAGTLKEQAGNSTDTASLLIALMRASGIPARYVTGVIELTYDQATAWLATDTIEDAQALLASGGIPVTGIIEGGTLSKLQLTQTYVEAYVNYENYRGASAGEGSSDWIPLDASYKTYEVSSPQADILSAMRTSYNSLSQEYLSSVSEDTFLAFIEAKIKTWLAANMPTLTLTDVMRTKSIHQENLGLLPSDLLLKLVSAESEERELAASARWKATLSLPNAPCSLEISLPELAGQDLEVCFTPATEDDAALLDSYDDLSQAPAYLINMNAEIKAGESSQESAANTFGASSSWDLSISCPGRNYHISNSLIWGTPFSVSLTPTPVPLNGEIKLEVGPNFPMCTLSQTAQSYISSCEEDDRKLASLYGLELTKGTQGASVGLSLKPQLISGIPISVSPGGIYIDADLSTATPAGGIKATRHDLTQASGLSSSAYEHKTLQDNFSSEAVSTSKLLALANKNAIPIVAIDRANASAIETLSLPAPIKQQMRDQVNAGYTITTSTQPIAYMDFTGEGWMVIDPTTGEGAYLISGGLSGGEVVEHSLDVELFLFLFFHPGFESVVLKNVYAYSPDLANPEDLPGKGLLANADYSCDINTNVADAKTSGGPSLAALGIAPGGSTKNSINRSITNVNSDEGAYLMGTQIIFENTYSILRWGQEKTLLSHFTLETSKPCYKAAGWYNYIVDFSHRGTPNNPYDNTTPNPAVHFELIPLVEKQSDIAYENGKASLKSAITDISQKKTVKYFIEKGGNQVELSPHYQIEMQGDPEASLTDMYWRLEDDTIKYCSDLLFPSAPTGRYIVSFYEPHCTTIEYLTGEGWDNFYNNYSPNPTTDPTYRHKVFFEMDTEIHLEFVKDSQDRDLGAEQYRGSGQFIDPFVVKVTDSNGDPVEGVSVDFTVLESKNQTISWYGYKTHEEEHRFYEYPGNSYPPKEHPLLTDKDGKARACMKVSDSPPVKKEIPFDIKITAKNSFSNEHSISTHFYCEPFTIDTDGDNIKDMRPEDITYAGRRLLGIPVPPGDYPPIWSNREYEVLDVMLRYDNENERYAACWPDRTTEEPNLSIVCIEVPRAAYQFAHGNIYNLMFNEYSSWPYTPSPGFNDDDMVPSRTWNWEEFFYFHNANNYRGEHSLLMGQIYDASGTNLVRYDLSYQLGDVALADLISDDIASSYHSGLVVDIQGDGDTAKYENICIIAADFRDTHRVHLFNPDPSHRSSWLTNYTDGEREHSLEELPAIAQFAYNYYTLERLLVIDNNIRINPHPSGILYHVGFRKPPTSQ